MLCEVEVAESQDQVAVIGFFFCSEPKGIFSGQGIAGGIGKCRGVKDEPVYLVLLPFYCEGKLLPVAVEPGSKRYVFCKTRIGQGYFSGIEFFKGFAEQ